MADAERKASDFLLQAEKRLKSGGGFFSSFFGGSSKCEEAAELYVKAGNNFKIAKKWPAAGSAFTKAAQLQLKLDSKHEAASHYVEAGNCFRKTDPEEAVNSLLKAIEIYTDMGQFSIAAKHHMTIGDIYSSDRINLEKAIVHYEQAADFYKGEESNSSANKNLLKVAQYSAQLEKYEKAISIYEQVAMSAIDNQLLRYSAKDHFFKAVLCRLCHNDFQDGSNSLRRYESLFPNFQDSRECRLLKALIAAMEEEKADAFTEAVREYDAISKLDEWCTRIMLRIKQTIPVEGQASTGDGDADLL